MMYDLILKNNISLDLIIQIINKVFKTSDIVDLYVAIMSETGKDMKNDIIYTLHQTQSVFPLFLSLYMKDSVSNLPESSVAILFAEMLNTTVVFSDNSINPYSWNMVKNDGRVIKCYENIDLDYDFSPAV